MESAGANPLKRSFETFESSQHETEPMDTDTTFTPTKYDAEVFEVAMRRNTIAVLDRKSLITVMMIREIGKSLKSDGNGGRKLIVFLTPTVQHVHQQYKEIQSQTELRVDEYYGARGVDEWDDKTWEKETDNHDVLIMTPQILLDALKKAFLSLESFGFIILDECHRATGKHPYAKIMEEFYHKSMKKPKIFGMTNSLLIRKGISCAKNSREQIGELERLLDSQVYMLQDEIIHEECIPSVNPICRFYEPMQPPDSELKAKLQCSWSKFDSVLLGIQNSLSSPYKAAYDKDKTMVDRLAHDYTGILFCLENLGILCAYEAVKVCIENSPKVPEDCELYKESVVQYENFLQEVLSIIEGSHEYKKYLYSENGGVAALLTGQISSKLHELLEICVSYGKDKDILCIIFVEKIIVANVIERLIKEHNEFSHFNVLYLTRNNSSEDELSVKFAGKVNLLFSTDVIEEGILEAKCSAVIRFDLPKSVSTYVQSRRLARKNDALYIIMLERGNTKQLDHVSYITRNENSTKHAALNHVIPDADCPRNKNSTKHAALNHVNPDADCPVKASNKNEAFQYVVKSTGASVTPESSVNIIQRYCENLPGIDNFTPKPKFELLGDGKLYRCKLILPSHAAFETVVGPLARESHLSRQLVCLDACRKLHTMGALTDYLLPKNNEVPLKEDYASVGKAPLTDDLLPKNIGVPLKEGCASVGKALTSGGGTTKRKELHGSTSIHMLSGTWGNKPTHATFHAYKMDFFCSIADQKYSSFVLLLESKLPDDVGNIEVDLYLLSKSVRSSVSSSGHVSLDAQQVEKAKCFQELIFNGLYGKLFVNSSGVRKLLLQTDESSLWDPSHMYLLLPLESENTVIEQPLKINWTGIESCVSVVEFLRKNALLDLKQKPDANAGSSSTVETKSSCHDNIIHLANISDSVDRLKEMVVVAIHTGHIYSILDIVPDSSSKSPFEGDADPSYSSYADYYHKKYGIILKYPEQPLLLLKQGHNSHNLLVDFRNLEIPFKSETKGRKKTVERKPNQHAHMPPELVVGAGIQTDILKAYYLLPSLMHRLECLMLASQLRDEISHHGGNFNIPSSLILEALTTQRCCESFSMERLELLGDSVLKFAVSCHLYLKYPKKDEGQLTSNRMSIIRNSTLHKLGTNRKLQEYVRDCAFDPRRWTAPGQRSIWPSECKHGLDTVEVPLDDKFFSKDINLKIGKTCDRGHRWMVSKTVSDCLEALIGAYHVGGGLKAAVSLMGWLGIEAGFDPSLVEEAVRVASLYLYAPKAEDIRVLESKLGYEFETKGLLLEAITHESVREQGVGYCYQRLEFLGDAVLDILITCHLYENHRNVDPGMLTDLRSASVNNDSFALAAVRANLHQHLQHDSMHIDDVILSFVKLVPSMSTTVLTPDIQGPKVLGDLVESIAGAVLIDCKLNLDEVWKVFKPLLSPIVTPEKLELAPTRELIELCDSRGYFIKEYFLSKGDVMHVVFKVQLEDMLLAGQGSGPNTKAAKGMAAFHLLKELELRGIKSSKWRKNDSDNADASISPVPADDNNTPSCGSALKKQKQLPLQPEVSEIPVVPPIDLKKGGPRTALYALCKKLQWPLPSFETTERKSRTPMQLGDTTGFNSFESQISLTIPNSGKIELTGEAKADKKSSFDSAALLMLYEVERRGKIIIALSN